MQKNKRQKQAETSKPSKTQANKQKIEEYILKNSSEKTSELANYLNLSEQRVRVLIAEHGLTAKTVAEETGISAGNISDWKSGRSMPASKKLVQLADYFGCTADYLLERTDTPYTVTVLDSVIHQIADNDRYFIDINKITHKPANSKVYCYIKHKDRGKIKKIYFLAEKFTGSIFSEKEYCSIFDYHSDPSAGEYGISLSAKNFLTFRKIYNTYLNAYINNRLSELANIE